MPDVFTKKKRSKVMSRIRGRGNKDTELALIRVFRAQRITGWRRQVALRATVEGSGLRVESRKKARSLRRIPSQHSTINTQPRSFRVRPDFVFPKLRLAVFVGGCFWHCCPIHATKPRQNATFWRRKLATNKARDRLVTRTLRSANWRVLRLWEHELAPKHEARLLRRIRRALA